VWWLVLPACLALLGLIATWHLSAGQLLYRY
jgi:undecaprenyl-diphosphatase